MANRMLDPEYRSQLKSKIGRHGPNRIRPDSDLALAIVALDDLQGATKKFEEVTATAEAPTETVAEAPAEEKPKKRFSRRKKAET